MKRGGNEKHQGNPGYHQGLFENWYSNKLENLEEMGKFLDTYDHPKQNQEHINHLNRSIIHNEIEAAIVSQIEKSKTWLILCWILPDL
jgi:hypothetical protein